MTEKLNIVGIYEEETTPKPEYFIRIMNQVDEHGHIEKDHIRICIVDKNGSEVNNGTILHVHKGSIFHIYIPEKINENISFMFTDYRRKENKSTITK